MDASCDVEPDPPGVGSLLVTCQFADSAGNPMSVADLRLEANMTHPGMQPAVTEMRSVEDERYAGTVEITMAGDWYLLVTGRTGDGRPFEHTESLAGVR